LKGLAEHNLVVYLTEPGRRGTVVTHGFHMPDELERERGRHAGGAADHEPAPVRSSGGSSALEARLNEALGEIAALQERLGRLEQTVDELRDRPPGS
jgi:hypothetical protein